MVIGFLVLTACAGCRDQTSQGRGDRNLGDKAGELMPVAAPPADERILLDQSTITEPTFEGSRRSEAGPAKKEPGETDTGEPKSSRAGEPAEKAPTTGRKPGPAGGPGGLGELMRQIEKDKKAPDATAGKVGAEAPTTSTAPSEGKPPAKAAPTGPAKPASVPPAKPSAAPGGATGTSQPASGTALLLSASGGVPGQAAGTRIIDDLSFSLPPPWQPWQPPNTQYLIAAFTQKGVADAGAWGFVLPKELKPEMANTEIGRFALAAKLKDEAKKYFEFIDQWAPGNRTTVIDGVQTVETRCTLKKGKLAGVEAPGEGVCFGIVGRTKGFLVAYRIPAGLKNADAVRKAVIDGIKMK